MKGSLWFLATLVTVCALAVGSAFADLKNGDFSEGFADDGWYVNFDPGPNGVAEIVDIAGDGTLHLRVVNTYAWDPDYGEWALQPPPGFAEVIQDGGDDGLYVPSGEVELPPGAERVVEVLERVIARIEDRFPALADRLRLVIDRIEERFGTGGEPVNGLQFHLDSLTITSSDPTLDPAAYQNSFLDVTVAHSGGLEEPLRMLNGDSGTFNVPLDEIDPDLPVEIYILAETDFAYNWPAPVGDDPTSHTITLDAYLDDFTFVTEEGPVSAPEPVTLTLLATGGMAALLRRRRKA